ncbi:TA system VapC family ribonuclease toxin [Candidatus Poriferisodalis sp.]|uniref:TA system VapC family ribonuclease toxin n=1 Tax=Candidatus Poriferisodalis sp. TaxID=3101277 RepID=UPI003B01AEEE
MTPLLDVNLLVALAWPTHTHHAAAVDWFTSLHGAPWATTPLVQLGFIRVSSNRRVLPDARSPHEAASVMRALAAVDGHEFWIDDVDPSQALSGGPERLTGYRQVTDAHLIALAERHGGCVATFDRAMASLADNESRVLVLNA